MERPRDAQAAMLEGNEEPTAKKLFKALGARRDEKPENAIDKPGQVF